MIETTLENASVAAIVAVVLSLPLEWFPGLTWWCAGAAFTIRTRGR